MPVAPGAPRVDFTFEEGSRFGFVIWQVEDGTGSDGPREPFQAGTTAYMDIRPRAAGDAIVRLGPEADALDGTLEVVAEDGEIRGLGPDGDLAVGLPFPADNVARYDLFLHPGGDAARRYRYLHGFVFYAPQITEAP